MSIKKIIRAAGLSCLCVAPTALIFGLITWNYGQLWNVMVVIHVLGFVGAMVMFLLPEEKQWQFIKALARMQAESGKNVASEPNEVLAKVEEFERKEKKRTPGQ
jgi:hypothetical protein